MRNYLTNEKRAIVASPRHLRQCTSRKLFARRLMWSSLLSGQTARVRKGMISPGWDEYASCLAGGVPNPGVSLVVDEGIPAASVAKDFELAESGLLL